MPVSAALNKALAQATDDIVIRIDADVEIAEEALTFVPGWFDDPTVGMVGALDLPNPRLRSWYAKGRLFECLVGFSYARRALQRIDAINCIPGTFTAFRPGPARSVGGFVDGMNGEDADLTMLMGRLGYRVVLDTRIRIYEDVPGSLRDFREQRTRWNRAGVHVFARHAPMRAGGGSARTWFFTLRAATLRVTAVLRPMVFATGVELTLLDPATRSRALEVLVFYLVAQTPTVAVIVVLAIRYGFARRLVWILWWYPFTLARRVIALEGMLTLPTRSGADAGAGPDRPPSAAAARRGPERRRSANPSVPDRRRPPSGPSALVARASGCRSAPPARRSRRAERPAFRG